MDARNSRSGRNLTKILKKTKRGYVVYYIDDHRPRKTSREMSLRRFITFLLCLTFLGFIAVQYVLMNRFLLNHQLAKSTIVRGLEITKNAPYTEQAALKNLSRKDVTLYQKSPIGKVDSYRTGNTTAPSNVARAQKPDEQTISVIEPLGYKMAAQDTPPLGEKMVDPKLVAGSVPGDSGANNVDFQAKDDVGKHDEALPKSSASVSADHLEDKVIVTGDIQVQSNAELPRASSKMMSTPKHSVRKVQNAPQELVFYVVICKGHPDNIMTDVRRQMRQCEVMLKSAVAFTNSLLRFIVCTDAVEVYRVLIEVTSMWAAEHRNRIVFERRPVWYPPGRPDLQDVRWPCSTAKLFQAYQFQDLDAVIYIDTDVLFLVPPENLWQEFSKFDSVQVMALAAEASADPWDPPRHDQEPRHTPHGLNTGVMLMNLTRMRQFPGRGWIGEVVTAFDTFVTVMTSTPSNRLVNIIFSQYPNLVRELDCEWNYVSKLCQGGDITCPQVWKRGVSLLHGYGHHFYYDSPKFMAVYQAWRNYELATPPKALLDTLKKNLEAATSGRLWPGCESIIDIDHVFIDPVRRTISNYLVNKLRRFVTQVYESLGLRRGPKEIDRESGVDFKM
ncbi:glucoside xylosyltransferase 1 isoform X1 [Penaeus vannamei]|uniref:glucoside xylosyltransferase 1 isoform X1 n=1 Tax=Penaeus vannamei TaxID=6689 RepID=UPI00387FA73D